MSLHVQRVADEVLLTIEDASGTTVVSLPVPEGVRDLIAALREAADPTADASEDTR